jgi:hypothetical protein
MAKGTVMKALMQTTVNLAGGNILVLDPDHQTDNRARYPEVHDEADIERLEREGLAEVFDGEVPELDTEATRRAAGRTARSGGEARTAERPRPAGAPRANTRGERQLVDKLVADHSQKDLAKMAEGLEGVKPSDNKTNLATAIVRAGRVPADTKTSATGGSTGAAGGSATGSTGETAGTAGVRGSTQGGPGVETEEEARRTAGEVEGEEPDPTAPPR